MAVIDLSPEKRSYLVGPPLRLSNSISNHCLQECHTEMDPEAGPTEAFSSNKSPPGDDPSPEFPLAVS